MNKSKVMETLLDSSCNIPSDIISFIGMNLPNDAENKVVFNHEADNMFEACGITQDDTTSLTKGLNDYMNSLPHGERANSKAVEYVLNSNNVKWLLLCIISTIKQVSVSTEENNLSDIKKEIITQMILKKVMNGDEIDEASINTLIKLLMDHK